jgi:hypothetical protein
MAQVMGAVSIWAALENRFGSGALRLRNHPASPGRTGRRDAGAKAAVDESSYAPANDLDRAGADRGDICRFVVVIQFFGCPSCNQSEPLANAGRSRIRMKIKIFISTLRNEFHLSLQDFCLRLLRHSNRSSGKHFSTA